MKCKLCLNEKKLCKQSHIIPDFMFQGLYDETHQLFMVDFKNPLDARKIQTGEFEKNILCIKCDNVRIGKLETYASSVIYGGKEIEYEFAEPQKGLKIAITKNIDYSKFKLFLLSILWRASLSKRKFFQNVDIGIYQEILRRMIIENNPGNEIKFPCGMITYLNDDSIPSDLIIPPKGNSKIAYFLIGGMFYIYELSKNDTPSFIKDLSIKENGELKILLLPKGEGRKWINDYCEEIIF